MAGYKRAGPHKPTGGLGYFPHSPGADNATPEQFHAILKAAITEYERRRTNDGFEHPLVPGMEAALALFEGYFGYFGGKEEK